MIFPTRLLNAHRHFEEQPRALLSLIAHVDA